MMTTIPSTSFFLGLIPKRYHQRYA
jgi:tetratricopeptide (TPR) repeat protein